MAPVCARTVLDLHNIESVLHARCAAAEGRATAAAHRVFQRASLELERTGCRDSRWCWPPRRTMPTWCARSRPGPGSRSTRTPCRPRRCRRPATRRPSSSPATWSIIPTSPPCGSSGARSGRGCASAGRRLIWRLVGKNPDAVQRFTAGDPRIEVAGPVDDAVRELARAGWRWYRCSPAAARASRFWRRGRPGCRWSPPRWAPKDCRCATGRHLLLADEPRSFRRRGNTAVGVHGAEAEELASAGRLLLEKEFTWETAWKKLDF